MLVELGLEKIFSAEIGLGCAGGIQAIDAVYAQIAKQCSFREHEFTYIVIGWEDVNVSINQQDSNTAALFSDACYVMIISNREDLSGRKIEYVNTMTIGTNAIYAMTIENPLFKGGIVTDSSRFKMDGRTVYKFGVQLWDYILHLNNNMYSEQDLRNMYMIPHQANKRMLLRMAENHNLNPNMIYTDGVGMFGNTTNSSAFIGLAENFNRQGKIIVTPFGAELMTGMMVIS